jgi:hypothetical protein
VYDFGFVAWRRHLSRKLTTWVKVEYVDGSYQEVFAHSLARPSKAMGLAPGSDPAWQAYGASAQARKAIASIEIFLCDTGPMPLSGTVQLSDVSLTARSPGGRAFAAVPILSATRR